MSVLEYIVKKQQEIQELLQCHALTSWLICSKNNHCSYSLWNINFVLYDPLFIHKGLFQRQVKPTYKIVG